MAKAKLKSKVKLKAVSSKPAKKSSPKKSPIKKVAKKAATRKVATVHSLADARAKSSPLGTSQKKKQQSNRDWTKIISPLDDRVLVQIVDEERMTAGGLYIPDTANVSGNFQASVVAVGRGHRDKKGRIRPLDLRVGDRVLIGQYSGNVVEIDGEKLQIVRESEVLGTLVK